MIPFCGGATGSNAYTNNFNESIGENPSLTSARNKANIECISGGGPSPNELAFGIELGPNPHSKRKWENNAHIIENDWKQYIILYGYQHQIVDKFKEKSQIKTNKTYISENLGLSSAYGLLKKHLSQKQEEELDLQYKNNFWHWSMLF